MDSGPAGGRSTDLTVYRVRMSAPELIRIVSRDSPMALAQVERVRAELAALHPGIATEVVPVKTTGDRWMGDLSQVEGKGAFTKEVDAALLAGEADLAVHCVKDMPARPAAARRHDLRRLPRSATTSGTR